jgi:hypothetical protein
VLNVTQKAVAAAGGTGKVARHFNLSLETIRRYCKADCFDAGRVVELCALTAGTFTPAQVRPDVFGGPK